LMKTMKIQIFFNEYAVMCVHMCRKTSLHAYLQHAFDSCL